MKRFLVGMAVGVVMTATSNYCVTHAAQVFGESGPLKGWTVVALGEELCSDPVIWTETQEIECHE